MPNVSRKWRTIKLINILYAFVGLCIMSVCFQLNGSYLSRKDKEISVKYEETLELMEAKMANKLIEMEKQNTFLKNQLSDSQNRLINMISSGKDSVKNLNISRDNSNIEHDKIKSQLGECAVINIAFVCVGYNDSRNVVTLVKSILFYRHSPLHFHIIADPIAQPILQTLFNSWRIPEEDFDYHENKIERPAIERGYYYNPATENYRNRR